MSLPFSALFCACSSEAMAEDLDILWVLHMLGRH